MRTRLTAFGLVAMLGVAAVAAWWLMPSSSINAENCELIREDMSIDEVGALLGRKGEDFYEPIPFEGELPSGTQIWQDGHCWIVVSYRQGKVQEANFIQRSMWDRVADWYHRRDWHPIYRSGRLESAV